MSTFMTTQVGPLTPAAAQYVETLAYIRSLKEKVRQLEKKARDEEERLMGQMLQQDEHRIRVGGCELYIERDIAFKNYGEKPDQEDMRQPARTARLKTRRLHG
jgi:hypothetical protein